MQRNQAQPQEHSQALAHPRRHNSSRRLKLFPIQSERVSRCFLSDACGCSDVAWQELFKSLLDSLTIALAGQLQSLLLRV